MVRLFNFVRNDMLTDIGGNIYYLEDILPIISRLSCFGITVEQLIIKMEYQPELHKIKKHYNNSIKKRDDTYREIEEKYQFVVDKYNELNPENKDIFLYKRHFEIKSNYTDEEKEFFNTEYVKYHKDMKYSDELDKIADVAIDKFDKAFGLSEELWDEIIFCKFIKVIHKNKYLVEIVPFLLPGKTKSGLKAGDQITINPLDINFLNPMDKIINKYIDKTVIDIRIIPLELPCVTDWSGRPYRNRETAVKLLNEGDTVRIQTNMENKVTGKIDTFCWYLEIIKFDSNKEWFMGITLSNYKNMDWHYEYDSEMKVDCLYYFHKNSILEIPIYENMEQYTQLEKEIIKVKRRGITGSVCAIEEMNVSLEEVMSKFI